MKDPKRLIESEVGLARDILQAASRQTAADESLAGALHLVDLALARKSSASVALRSGAARASGPARQGHQSPKSEKEPPGPRARMGSWAKLALALKAPLLLPVGAAMAAAVGGTAVVSELFQRLETQAAARVEHAPRRSAPQGQSAAAPLAILTAPDFDESRAPGLDSTGPRERTEALALPPTALRPQLAGPPLNAAVAAPRSGREAVLPGDDWLGQQFTLLGNARRTLEAGNPTEALEILDDYARRFPDGTLLPQAADLRQRAGEARRNEASGRAID